MNVISLSKLLNLLSSKLGFETAEGLTSYIELKINKEVNSKSLILATKEDLNKEISRLDVKITETRYDLIKWMFIFWIGQVAATFGFILLFLKK